MSTERAIVALLLAALVAACSDPTCIRNSDCPPSLTCSTSGVCGDGLIAPDAGPAPDAADDAALDASVDASVDAATDAAIDGSPTTLGDPTPEPAPPIVTGTSIDAGVPSPTLDLLGATRAPATLASNPAAP